MVRESRCLIEIRKMLTGSFFICVLLISSVGMYPGDVAHV